MPFNRLRRRRQQLLGRIRQIGAQRAATIPQQAGVPLDIMGRVLGLRAQEEALSREMEGQLARIGQELATRGLGASSLAVGALANIGLEQARQRAALRRQAIQDIITLRREAMDKMLEATMRGAQLGAGAGGTLLGVGERMAAAVPGYYGRIFELGAEGLQNLAMAQALPSTIPTPPMIPAPPWAFPMPPINWGVRVPTAPPLGRPRQVLSPPPEFESPIGRVMV